MGWPIFGEWETHLHSRFERCYYFCMRTVTTTEAKAKLNSLLSAVAAGEIVTITNHGRPVAVLSQPAPPTRKLGQFAGLISIPDDFDAPMDEDDLALWGEGE